MTAMLTRPGMQFSVIDHNGHMPIWRMTEAEARRMVNDCTCTRQCSLVFRLHHTADWHAA